MVSCTLCLGWIPGLGIDTFFYADFGGNNFFIQFPENSILPIFWNCVGCFILKTTQCVNPFTLVIFIYERRGTYLISRQPTQFQLPLFLSRSVTTLISEDLEFSCASIDLYENFARGCPPTQTPTHKLKSRFSTLSSQEICSRSVSFEMIFQALQLELFRLKFNSLS